MGFFNKTYYMVKFKGEILVDMYQCDSSDIAPHEYVMVDKVGLDKLLAEKNRQ